VLPLRGAADGALALVKLSAAYRLGSWTCPSGNSCDVVIAPKHEAVVVEVRWDEAPPLRIEDAVFYVAVIRPAIVRLAREYLECP
jgi:hypothetical protein